MRQLGPGLPLDGIVVVRVVDTQSLSIELREVV